MKLIDNSSKTNWKFIASVAVLGLLAGGGIVWYANLPTPAPQPIEIPNIKKPTPQQIVDTSTWQTYRNDEFGFEVRYPKNWQIKEKYDYHSKRIYINSPNGSVILIAPLGYAAGSFEGLKSKKQQGKIGGKSMVIDSFLTEANVKWQQFIRFSEYPQTWEEYNYIFTQVRFLNLTKKCRKEITPQHTECGLEDGIAYFGEVDQREKETIDQILSTFRFVEYEQFSGVPKTYEECAKIGKSNVIELSELGCKYSVSYSEKNETNKKKYLECQKIGGIVSSFHGDTFDPNNPPISIYSCNLNFYDPNYQFPKTFQECRDSQPERLRAFIDLQQRCNIAIENITYHNKDIANNLMGKCIALGGSYTEYPNPRFARTQCVIWFDKTKL